MAAVIIPNVSKFIGTSNVAAANSELAQVGTAGQAAAGNATGGTLTAQLIDPGNVAASPLGPYVQGKIKGAYYINTDGSVVMGAAALVTAGASGDPSYPGLYWSTSADQYTSTAAGNIGPGPATDP